MSDSAPTTPDASATQPSGQPPLIMAPGLEIGPNGKPRFSKGNKLGGGTRSGEGVRKSIQLRDSMINAVTVDEINLIMKRLIVAALNGNITAAREVLDRTVGKAEESSLIARLEELEEAFVKSGKQET